jgi:hypothetical protein
MSTNPNSTHHAQLIAIKALCEAIVSAVDVGGAEGATGGILYAALMQQGCTLDQFSGIMAGMVGAGILCKVGERYFLGELGLEMVRPVARFKIGDAVIFTNDQGCVWEGKTVTEVKWTTYGDWQGWGYRYLPSDSPWFFVREDRLRLKGGQAAS